MHAWHRRENMLLPKWAPLREAVKSLPRHLTQYPNQPSKFEIVLHIPPKNY
jgi:hypothetical protein